MPCLGQAFVEIRNISAHPNRIPIRCTAALAAPGAAIDLV